MSGQLRAIKNRIRSVENTKKITHAMEMVAAAKLRRFQDVMVKARPYTKELNLLSQKLIQDQLFRRARAKKGDKYLLKSFHPFFEPREEKRIALVLITSDTGLCGSYNTDLTLVASEFLSKCPEQPYLIGVGKMGLRFLQKNGFKFQRSFTDLRVSRIEGIIQDLRSQLEQLYLEKEVDAIYVIYSHFLTVTTYQGVVEKLLPLEQPDASEQEKSADIPQEFIYEPDAEKVFEKLVPQMFESRTRMILLESLVSEQIARMNAMRQATDNAKEMIDTLVLKRNKARQAAITKEIIEIVSGSRALKK